MTLIDKSLAVSAVRQALVDAAYTHGSTMMKASSAMFKAEIYATNAIAALPARGVGVTWHPFDTAPRDGSRFLAQGGGLDAIDICSYNARVGCWDCGSVTLDDTDHEPEGYNRPAQWMPLAALAPTDGEAK